jgi:CheY-like chemotaxis protein
MAQVLFVDDDIATLQLMRTALEILGHQALLSSSSQEALAMAVQYKPSVIFIDHNLAESDGCSLITTLCQIKDLHHTAIYLVSAMITDEDIRCARSAGAQGFIEKPIDFRRLSDILTSGSS